MKTVFIGCAFIGCVLWACLLDLPIIPKRLPLRGAAEGYACAYYDGGLCLNTLRDVIRGYVEVK